MEKQIREIISQHVGGTYEAKQKCTEEILRLFSVSGRSELLKCYHYNHEWKSDGQGGNLKYCNDCKCYV